MKINIGKCFLIGFLSFVIMLAALISIPGLHEIETCVRSAIIITAAYAWFTCVLWANVILPLIEKGE